MVHGFRAGRLISINFRTGVGAAQATILRRQWEGSGASIEEPPGASGLDAGVPDPRTRSGSRVVTHAATM
jgi:hypothetical protein